MRKGIIRDVLLLAAAIATLLPHICQAQVTFLPPSVTTQIVPCCGVAAQTGPGNAGAALTYSDTINGVSAQATTSLGSTTVAPYATASLSTQGLDISAFAEVEYDFTINPTAAAPTGTLETIDVVASGSVGGSVPTVGTGAQTPVGSAEAFVYYTDATTQDYTIQNAWTLASTQLLLQCVSGSFQHGCSVSGENNPTGASSFSTNTELPVQVGDTVSIDFGAIVRSPTLNTASFSATLDPRITLDPSDTPGLTLEFSPGIVEPIVTPLPAAAWLLLSGLGGMVGIAHRRRYAGGREIAA